MIPFSFCLHHKIHLCINLPPLTFIFTNDGLSNGNTKHTNIKVPEIAPEEMKYVISDERRCPPFSVVVFSRVLSFTICHFMSPRFMLHESLLITIGFLSDATPRASSKVFTQKLKRRFCYFKKKQILKNKSRDCFKIRLAFCSFIGVENNLKCVQMKKRRE